MNTVVIGHDYREQDAYDVCLYSLRKHSPTVRAVRLQERDLRRAGVYDRPFRVDEAGQFYDERDGRPFSTAFAFARFLTPLVARGEGQARGHALFVDCDFLFLRPVEELFALADPNKAVQVVQHRHAPTGASKMDDMAQTRYARKNWSSCILWNLDHPANDVLTPRMVNTMPGSWLHGFQWLPDDLIGTLPERWNWLVGHSPTTGEFMCPANGDVGALHYTDGGPWFAHMRDCPLASFWLTAQAEMRAAQRAPMVEEYPAWAAVS